MNEPEDILTVLARLLEAVEDPADPRGDAVAEVVGDREREFVRDMMAQAFPATPRQLAWLCDINQRISGELDRQEARAREAAARAAGRPPVQNRYGHATEMPRWIRTL